MKEREVVHLLWRIRKCYIYNYYTYNYYFGGSKNRAAIFLIVLVKF